ncbi:MAG: DUF3320 domain-containing protein, partial [Planctomycetota bacterium]
RPAREPEEAPAASAAASAVAPEDPDGPRPYVLCDGAPQARDDEAVRALLQVEAPVVFERLVRRLAEAWGVSRVSDRVRARARAALPSGVEVDGPVVWLDRAQRDAFRGYRVPACERGERSADELPLTEVRHAMSWLLRQHHALAREDLMRECARAFGIARLGSNVREVMALGVDALVAAGGAARVGETISLP